MATAKTTSLYLYKLSMGGKSPVYSSCLYSFLELTVKVCYIYMNPLGIKEEDY
jgi:hypothetical protein